MQDFSFTEQRKRGQILWFTKHLEDPKKFKQIWKCIVSIDEIERPDDTKCTKPKPFKKSSKLSPDLRPEANWSFKKQLIDEGYHNIIG